MRAAEIENGKVINVIEVEQLDVFPDKHLVYGEDADIGDDYVDGGFVKPVVIIPEKSAEELIKHYDYVVQSHLDAVAQSFGYGDPNRPEVSPILHAISYAEEPAVERFMNEGKALRAWRSLVWVAAAGILNAVKAGERVIPTEAQLLAELPPPPTQEPL